VTELVICRGLPGSGKTTFARQQLVDAAAAGQRGSVVRSNRDDYWAMMFDLGCRDTPTEEIDHVVTIAQHTAIRGLLRAGVDVICDDTNLYESIVISLVVLAEAVDATWRIQDFTHVPVEVCILRDRARAFGVAGGFVGEQIIQRMYTKHSPGGWAPMPVPELDQGVR
jgi:tRNA uridine 5-carbamoylmethylation protein Kti12